MAIHSASNAISCRDHGLSRTSSKPPFDPFLCALGSGNHTPQAGSQSFHAAASSTVSILESITCGSCGIFAPAAGRGGGAGGRGAGGAGAAAGGAPGGAAAPAPDN